MVGGSRRGTHKNWATKVKTGCLTCKRRRIKCDETKPSCRRCATHHVNCEGYPDLSYQPHAVLVPSNVSSSLGTAAAGSTPLETMGNNLPDTSKSFYSSMQTLSNPGSSYDTSWTHNRSSPPAHIVRSYPGPASFNAWTESFSPYTNGEQRLALTAWKELAPSMSRSQDGLNYWNIAIPTISWGQASVRNALMAASTIYHSLRRKDSPSKYAVAEARAVQYANDCIQELVSTTVPPEAMIACATLFWIFEMMSGNWTNSLKHLAAGFRISESTSLNAVSEPRVPQYIRSFVGSLPAPINPEHIVSMSNEDQLLQSNARRQYARPIMRDALDRLKVFRNRLERTPGSDLDRTIQIIGNCAKRLKQMYHRWPVRVDYIDEPTAVSLVVHRFSPFIRVMEDAETFFQENNMQHMEEFVENFGSSVDHFIWLGACLHLHERQQLIEAWCTTPQPYRRDESFLIDIED